MQCFVEIWAPDSALHDPWTHTPRHQTCTMQRWLVLPTVYIVAPTSSVDQNLVVLPQWRLSLTPNCCRTRGSTRACDIRSAAHALSHRSCRLQTTTTRQTYDKKPMTACPVSGTGNQNQTSSSAMAERQRKLETFLINVQRYSQNYAQNCTFGPPYVRIGRNVSGLFESFNAKKLCSRVSSRQCQFYSLNSELAFLSHHFGWAGLTGNVCDSSLAGWKACGRLPINYNWIFFTISYGWGTNTSKLAFVEGGGSLWG